jgi:hypothetical protein
MVIIGQNIWHGYPSIENDKYVLRLTPRRRLRGDIQQLHAVDCSVCGSVDAGQSI